MEMCPCRDADQLLLVMGPSRSAEDETVEVSDTLSQQRACSRLSKSVHYCNGWKANDARQVGPAYRRARGPRLVRVARVQRHRDAGRHRTGAGLLRWDGFSTPAPFRLRGSHDCVFGQKL